MIFLIFLVIIYVYSIVKLITEYDKKKLLSLMMIMTFHLFGFLFMMYLLFVYIILTYHIILPIIFNYMMMMIKQNIFVSRIINIFRNRITEKIIMIIVVIGDYCVNNFERMIIFLIKKFTWKIENNKNDNDKFNNDLNDDTLEDLIDFEDAERELKTIRQIEKNMDELLARQ